MYMMMYECLMLPLLIDCWCWFGLSKVQSNSKVPVVCRNVDLE